MADTIKSITNRILWAAHGYLPGVSQGSCPEDIPVEILQEGKDALEFCHGQTLLSYAMTRDEVVHTFYKVRDWLAELITWASLCQYRAFIRHNQGLPTSWAWDLPKEHYFINPIAERFGESTQAEYNNHHLISRDPRLITYTGSATTDLVIHPTESHYAIHYPNFDAFSKNPLPEIIGCKECRAMDTEMED